LSIKNLSGLLLGSWIKDLVFGQSLGYTTDRCVYEKSGFDDV
jgi:hypothetical protein